MKAFRDELIDKLHAILMDNFEYVPLYKVFNVADALIKSNNDLKDVHKYIFYSKGTNHDNADDVAVTEAKSLDEAVENFKKYYANVSKENVRIIDCYREGFAKNMMIISDY